MKVSPGLQIKFSNFFGYFCVFCIYFALRLFSVSPALYACFNHTYWALLELVLLFLCNFSAAISVDAPVIIGFMKHCLPSDLVWKPDFYFG